MKYFIFLFLLFLSVACGNESVMVVAEQGKYKDYAYTIPFDISADNKRDTFVELGVIYEGMPAKDLRLYGFGQKELITAYNRGSNKYLVFPKKNNDQKVVIFVVRKSKVIDWFEEDAKLVN